MAVQMASYLSGRMENIVFYKRSGGFFARSMPVAVKQTTATKIRSRNFGVASSAGKALRSLLLPVLPFPKDRMMQMKFSGAIAQWLKLSSMQALQPSGDVPFVNHFNFNDARSIPERCKIPIAVMHPSANLIEVRIPAFVPAESITAPAHTATVKLTVTAASCRLKEGTALGNLTSTINIHYNDELRDAELISLPVPTDAGTVVIVAAALVYTLSDQAQAKNIAFMPSSVIDARYL